MIDEELAKTIVHLIFEAAKGKKKAIAKFNEYASDPSTSELAERCRVAAFATMTPKALKHRPEKLARVPRRAAPKGKLETKTTSALRAPRTKNQRPPENTMMCTVCGSPAIPGDSVCFRHCD